MISSRFAKWNLIVVSAVLLFVYFWIDPSGRSSEIFRFFGRLHPAIVHMPIGIMVLALILVLLNRFRWIEIPDSAINITLVLGSWAGIKAILAGSWLSQTGGYPTDLLFLHKVMGFGATTLCAAIVFFRTSGIAALQGTLVSVLSWGLMLAWLIVGGDIGGQMTHGRGFVTEYAPGFVTAVIGKPDPMRERFNLSSPGTTSVYEGIISPIFIEKCSSCHGETRGKGKLRLHSRETIESHEGDEPLILAGRPDESLLLKRLSLPEGHEDQMPPHLHAKPVSHADVELIRWWIAEGASFDRPISDTNIPASVNTILQAYGLGVMRTGVFALDIAPPDSVAINALREKGVRVDVLAEGENLLSVQCRVAADCLGSEIDALAGQITWLDLRESDVTDADLVKLVSFPHLTRLNLSGTNIDGSGLAALNGTQYLEYLNVYDSKVNDAALELVGRIKTLTAVYLWQTAVTPEGVANLKSALPDAEINTGIQDQD